MPPILESRETGTYISRDPWQNRSAGMRCETCIWFVLKKGNVGRCRRHAPTMNGYPVTFINDWCGDHKLDENPPTATSSDYYRVQVSPT
jgi:hypothetical protein